MYKEISLEKFKSEVESASELCVDLNALLQVCGASPIHVHYKTDKVIVITTFPEQLALKSGNSTISVSQIQKVEREISGAKCTYRLHCGLLDELKSTLIITLI